MLKSPNATHLTRRSLLAFGAGLAAAPALLATSTPAEAMTSISFNGWQAWTFRGIPPTDFGLGGNALTINASQSSSVVYGVVPRAARNASSASWQWQVSQTVGPTNLAARGGDDRAIALYFVFVDAATADRFGDSTPSMSRLLGMRGGRTLIYVWGGNAQRGAVLDSPYLRGRGKTVVLRSAGTRGWTGERVDLAADHVRAFGQAKETLIAVGVSSDSDDTGAVNVAGLRNLSLG
ncbi:MAG: DUF3047 domain-containing protein [Rhizobiales bacterium]|nr:DUF3047 domain-containing protein [Hyphomicrobiales bacterium]MBO6700538.1 DUF3047 domain-containing protein [Hyphomicrobiales bacterium]MBO6738074.1 DUF3047 domain-containing protein [Hyphomicrobiales bacterium]MBO6913619.1 DUF3047 domain-containing protein [Hyphomicrobiales bacterium]MBO6954484.1 DUF3047 domain-containing protein [Hyphomicrobiales bacterium]